MKNIHLMPTDKPSRLMLRHGILFFFKDDDSIPKGTAKNQNIYITNNEEIKEGDWIYYTLASGYCKTTVSSKGLKQKGIPAKKIILTTDQDLIKDGVQAIDDEFLEWYVQNPSCEKVKVVKENLHIGEVIDESYPKGFLDYKIIIPSIGINSLKKQD